MRRRVLDRLSVSVVDREIGRLVYTQWLNSAGGIAADLTVTRLGEEKFLVVASDLIHRRIEPMIRREARSGETVVVTEITSGTTLLSVQGPKSRALLSRLTDADLSNDAISVSVGEGDPRRLRTGACGPGDLPR